jgi:hypothetical protein
MNEMQESITSIKYGLCKAMSEYGISPSDFEEALSKTAFLDGLSKFNPFSGIISPAFTIALGGGALAGVGSAVLRKKVEDIGKGTEDSEMRKTRMKIDMYKKMINDLKTDQTSLPA